MRTLSTIEMTILAIAWLRGPCSTYTVMKELASSESTYYKSRAGTTYSVAKRLIGFGLMEQEGEEGMVRVTAAGLVAIREWMSPPIPMADIAHSADLVRLRFFFLGALDPKARLTFIDTTLDGLRKHLKRCEALVSESEKMGDPFGSLATLSIVMETKARIEWLEKVRERVAAIP